MPRQILRSLQREDSQPQHNRPALGFARKARRALGIGGLAAAAALLFVSQAQAFNKVRDHPAKAHVQADKLHAMSLLSIRLFRKGTGLAVLYDTRFGTATDANGWFTFDLHSGNRRIWVNSSGGNDANDGLTAATAKATFSAALTLFRNGSFTAGDQFMIAGTGGRTYTDPGGLYLTSYGGISAAYPLAILSYDPATPADATKYGKLVGANMPSLSLPANPVLPSIGIYGNSGTNYFAVQGIEFNGQDLSGQEMSFTGRHNGVVFQNCRFKTVQLTLNGSDTAGDGIAAAFNWNLSKCSFWGSWGPNKSQGAYIGFVDGLWCQDCVLVHCGWRVSSSRSVTTGDESATVFAQGTYYSGHNRNGRFDRAVYADTAANGFNIRGDAVCTSIVGIDEPIAASMGGTSTADGTGYLENPSGSLVTLDDFAFMGGADINTSLVRGGGFNSSNAKSGSYARNGAMFDNPKYGDFNNSYLSLHSDENSPAPDIYLLMDNVRGYNYSPTVLGSAGTFPAKAHPTISNSILDALASGGTNSVHAGLTTYPNAKTRDQVITAVLSGASITPGASYTARKAQLVNLMLWRPDLQWAQMLLTIALPAYGLSLTKTPTVSPPNLSAETPATVY